MPEQRKHIAVYWEGHDDRVVLQTLSRLFSLPLEIIPQRTTSAPGQGKEAMLQDAAALLQTGHRCIAVRDFDELTTTQIETWALSQLGAACPEATVTKVGATEATSDVLVIAVNPGKLAGRIALVPAGLPGEKTLVERFDLSQFAMDDHLLLLAMDPEIYGSISEQAEVKHPVAMSKLDGFVKALRDNGVEVKHSKRLLHLLRGITGFRASPATYAGRLMDKALSVKGKDFIEACFSSLLQRIREAVSLLGQQAAPVCPGKMQ